MFVYVWVGLGFFLSLLTSNYDAINMFFRVIITREHAQGTRPGNEATIGLHICTRTCVRHAHTYIIDGLGHATRFAIVPVS